MVVEPLAERGVRGDFGVPDAQVGSRRNRSAGRSRARRAGPAPRARGAAAHRRAAPRERSPGPRAPGSSRAPCHLRSTGWRPVRDAEASDARHRRAGSAFPWSRSAAARDHTAPIGTSSGLGFNSRSMRGSQPANSAPKNIGIAGRRPRFLHLLIRRHEPDVVDELSGAHRKGEKVLALAEPHLPALGRPMRDALMRHQAAVGDRPGEHRPATAETHKAAARNGCRPRR